MNVGAGTVWANVGEDDHVHIDTRMRGVESSERDDA